MAGDRVGDGLIKLPVLRGLRAALPDARIVWLAGRRPSAFRGPLAPLADGLVDEVIDAAGVGVRWRELAAPAPLAGRRFHTVVDTGTRLLPALVLRRLAVEAFIGAAAGYRLSSRVPAGLPGDPSVESHLCRLFTLAAGRPVEPRHGHRLPPAYEACAARLLPQAGSYVGFAPGAGGERKRWPLERFCALARRQADRGLTPVFFLGPEEAGWMADIAAAVPGARFPEAGAPAALRGPVLGIALARRLRAAVANDAGGGHILAAGGVPVVTLFGPTSAEKFATPRRLRVVLEARAYGGEDVAAIPLAAVEEALHGALAGGVGR